MQAIPAARLVDAWERGSGEHPVRRALTLLRLIEPALSSDTLAALSLGQRDRRLLDLRERLAGSQFDATAACPACQERLDLVFTADDLPAAVPDEAAIVDVAADGYFVQARVLSSADLLAIVDGTCDEPARTRLLRRSVVSMRRGDEPVTDASTLPPGVTSQLETKLADADPMSDLHLTLSCPACHHRWEMAFDISRYVWEEVSDRALRLLREIHAIASAYGWSEEDILSMSDARRQGYLGLIEGA